MNTRQARAAALHAASQQVEALLEADYLYGFEEGDQPKVERELEHISDRLMERALNLNPDLLAPRVYHP